MSPLTVGLPQGMYATLTPTQLAAAVVLLQPSGSAQTLTLEKVPTTSGLKVITTSLGDISVNAFAATSTAAPPATPTNFIVTAGSTKVTPVWDNVARAMSYNLYWSTLGAPTKLSAKITGATSGSPLTGLTNGTTYFYVVTAVNAAGESPVSAAVSVTPRSPPPPTLVSLNIAPGSSAILFGSLLQYSAVGTYSDGSVTDMTAQTTWSETDGSGSATIGASGLLNSGTGHTGMLTIGATVGSLSASTSLTLRDYTISTVAGVFYPTLGVGGPATAAVFIQQSQVAVDLNNNLYIADVGNHVVRRIDATTGFITNIAGTGFASFSGDGGPAATAGLSQPSSVAIDASGNIFIADKGNNRIRKINAANGLISTVAGGFFQAFGGDGGPATAAYLNGPIDVAVTATGDFYIADQSNQRIRLVSGSTGIITTVAGNGGYGFAGDGGLATAANFAYPYALAVDASGNLYIADSDNYRIRKVTATTGNISTIVGTGAYGDSGDGGLATSAQIGSPYTVRLDASGNIDIGESASNRIRQISATTGIISTIVGSSVTSGYTGDGGLATNAEMTNAVGLAFDSSGNLFISDAGNYVVRKVTASTGIISTVAGHDSQFFSGDGGPALNAELNSPISVAVKSNGDFYIGVSGGRVRMVNAATGTISTVAGNGTLGNSGDGGPATAAEMITPTGLALDATGNLFIADQFTSSVRRIDATSGTMSTVAGVGVSGFSGDGGIATAANLSFPYGVAAGAGGNLYISDSSNERIERLSAPPA